MGFGFVQFVFFFMTFAGLNNELVTTLRIDVSPSNVDGIIPSDVIISCNLDRNDNMALSIVSMEVNKDGGKPVAFIRQDDDQIHLNTANQTRFQAKGRVAKEVDLSYIRLTVHQPKTEDSGVYTCVMYYLDQSGVLKEVRDSRNLTVTEQDIYAVVENLMNKVSEFDKQISDQIKTIARQEDLINGLNTTSNERNLEAEAQKQKVHDLERETLTHTKALLQLSQQRDNDSQLNKTVIQQERTIGIIATRFTDVQQELVSLKLESKDKKERIDLLEHKMKIQENRDSFQCAFSSAYKNSDPIVTFQPLLFTNPTTNIGNAYNVTSGKFTAPVAGLYVFQLVAMKVRSGGYVYVDLLANDKIVAQLYTKDPTDYDQSSVNTVVSLDAGDEVYPRVSSMDGQNILYPFHYSQFSGFLLKMNSL